MRPIRACVGRWNKVPLVLVFGVCIARSQLVPPLLDTSQQRQQAIRVGMTRIAFTSVFFGDALVEQLVAGGTLSIQQQYRGTSLLTGIRSFRDDELLRLQWRYPIAESLMLVPHVEWDVSNDSRSLGISRLERVRGAAGVGYSSLIGAQKPMLVPNKPSNSAFENVVLSLVVGYKRRAIGSGILCSREQLQPSALNLSDG